MSSDVRCVPKPPVRPRSFALRVLILAAFAAPTLRAQTGEPPVIYKLPSGEVPTIYYQGDFGHYYYSSSLYTGQPKEFPVWVFAPIRPASNGYALVDVVSAGFVSGGAYDTPALRLSTMQAYEKKNRRYLEEGFTVFALNHGDPSTNPPGWIIPEIFEQSQDAMRAIKAAIGTAHPGGAGATWFHGLPTATSTPPAPNGSYPNLGVTNLGLNLNRIGIWGGSSGAGVAINIYLKGASGTADATFPDAGVATAQTVTQDSSAWAVVATVVGGGFEDWRTTGDTAGFWGSLSVLLHADLTNCTTAYGAPPTLLGLSNYAIYNFIDSNCPDSSPGTYGPNDCGEAYTLLPYFRPPTFNGCYPVWPGAPAPTTTLAEQYVRALGAIDFINALPSWSGGKFLQLNGDLDQLVTINSANRLNVAAGTKIPHTYVVRNGEGHGWKDLDKDDEGLAIRFFINELGVRVDADGDGRTGAQETTAGTDSADSDSDGDGQSDGSEFRLGTSPLDARQDFAIDGLTSVRAGTGTTAGGVPATGTPAAIEYFLNTLAFRGPANANFVVQWTDELPDADYAAWQDETAFAVTAVGGQPGRYTATVRTAITAVRTVNYLRVRWVDPTAAPGVAHSRIATAPVGQRLTTIHRAASGYVWNYLAPALHAANEVQADTTGAADDPASLWAEIKFKPNAANVGPFDDPANPGNTLDLSADALGTRYVAVVIRDASRDLTQVKPEDRGWEGRWWEVVKTIDDRTLRVLRHDASNGQLLFKLPAGSEIAVRRLSTLEDMAGLPGAQATDPLSHVVTDTLLTGFKNDETLFEYDRVAHTVLRYRYQTNVMGHLELEPTVHTAGCQTPPALPTAPATWPVSSFANIRFLPDEAIAIRAKSDQTPPRLTWFVDTGWVPMSDLVAYLEPEIVNNAAAPWPSPLGGACVLGDRRMRSWPFPQDAALGNNAGDALITQPPLKSAIMRPTSGLVESNVVTTTAGGSAPAAADDFVYVADPADYLALGALFGTTVPYSGDDAGLQFGGRIDPQSLLYPIDHLLPYRHTWFVPAFGVLSAYDYIPPVPPSTPATFTGASFGVVRSGVLNDVHLRGGRGYEMRVGANGVDVREWLRRRPYLRPE
jgi:hypothetical protein